ncbi:MAG: hypothetical protein PHD27_09185 [Eubacteriales bacterium]|nr:hypothetical protein [Eubacteriales bacterium]
MSFKSRLQLDNKAVFLNTSEFAETRNVRYENTIYEIPVVMEKVRQLDRPAKNTLRDHAEGLYESQATLYCALSDFILPEHGTRIEITDADAPEYYRTYYIVSSGCDAGMVTLELEAIDE